MLKKSLIILTIVLLLFIINGFYLPHEFDVEHSVVINAGTERIHPYVDDLRQWPKWTPWQEMEPEMTLRYGNVTRGVGASQSWHSKNSHGRLIITASSPNNGIAYDIFFDNDTTPSISAIEYKVNNTGSTLVTWRLHGDINLPVLGGYVAIFVSTITRDMYRTGLQNLKVLVEKYK